MSDNLTILQGDCVESMNGFLESESVQCCVTSPPYFGLRSYLPDGHELKPLEVGSEKSPAAYVAKMVAVFDEVRRVLRKDGTLWLNLGDSYAAQRGGTPMPAETLAGGISGQGDTVAKRGRESGFVPHRNAASIGLKHKDLMGIPWRVAFALQAVGWYLRSDIIWSKPNPMPESVTDRPTKAHEYMFLLTKSARYYYDHEAVKEPVSAASLADGRSERGTRGTKGEYAAVDGNCGFDPSGRNRRSVWEVTTACFPGAHFATYPPELITPCILAGTKPGDTVLDPFGGSGTTGQVALELGRKAILCELNPDYIKLIRKRCDVTFGLPL